MSLIFCKVTYGPTTSDGSFAPRANYSGVAFDTDTLQMVPVSGTWRGAMLDPKPADVYLNTGDVIYWVCPLDLTDHTATMYRFTRVGDTFTTSVEGDSVYCGYVAPDTRTCNILISDVVVTEDTATIQTTGAIGPLAYSLNGGATKQSSPLFEDLAGDTDYVATVLDFGATLPGCKHSVPFKTAAYDPLASAAAVDELPRFCFAGNPVVVTARSARPLRNIRVEVYVETAHRSGAFTRVYEAKRRTDADNTTVLDVADILMAQLQAELNPAPGWHTLTKPIRNWFVRVADINPATGKPGMWTTSNNSVVLRGGLPPEPLEDGADYFLNGPRFMTWAPSTKQVGAHHREVVQLLVLDVSPGSIILQPMNAAGQLLDISAEAYQVPAVPAPVANLVVPPALDVLQRARLTQFVLNLEDFGDAHMLEMSVDDDGIITGMIRFVIDRLNRNEPRQLIFENSLAGFDTVAMTGKLSGRLGIESSGVEVYRPLQAGAISASQELSWPTAPIATSYKLSTGLTSTRWLEYLQELVTPGRQVFEYYAGRIRPIILTTKELNTYEDEAGHTAAIIEYRPATKNNYYADYVRNSSRGPAAGPVWG